MSPSFFSKVPFLSSNLGDGDALLKQIPLALSSGGGALANVTSLVLNYVHIEAEVVIDSLTALVRLSFPLLRQISLPRGRLEIIGCNNLDDLYLSKLVRFDQDLLLFTGAGLKRLHLDSLTGTDNGYSLDLSTNTLPNLLAVTLTALASCGSDLSFQASSLSTLSLPALTTVTDGLVLATMPVLVSFSAPLLTHVGGSLDFTDVVSLPNLNLPLLATLGGSLVLSNVAALATLSLPVLTSIGGQLIISGPIAILSLPLLVSIGSATAIECPSLVTVSLPALTTIDDAVDLSGCPSLTTFSFPALTTFAHYDFLAPGAALNVASVNAILRKLVLISWGAPGSTLDLSGGTSAAPTGQGIIDKATLITAGAVVLTN